MAKKLTSIPKAQRQETEAGKRIFEKCAKLLFHRDQLYSNVIPYLETLSHSIGVKIEIQYNWQSKQLDFNFDSEDLEEIEEQCSKVFGFTMDDLENLAIINRSKMQLIQLEDLFPHRDNHTTFKDNR